MADTAMTTTAGTGLKRLDLNNADSMLSAAKELTKFIKDNNLSSNIQGKQYPNVEAWQFLFTLAGLTYTVDEPVKLEGEGPSVDYYPGTTNVRGTKAAEIIYRCTCFVYDANGRIITKGSAICSNREKLKVAYEQYAIYSFVQTRSIGKAGRNLFAFVLKAAGYEATPSEEEGGTFTNERGSGAHVVYDNPADAPKLQVVPMPAALEPPMDLLSGQPLTAALTQRLSQNLEAVSAAVAPALPPALAEIIAAHPNITVGTPGATPPDGFPEPAGEPAAPQEPALSPQQKAAATKKANAAKAAAPAAAPAPAPEPAAAPEPAPAPSPAPASSAPSAPDSAPAPAAPAAAPIANSGKSPMTEVMVQRMIAAVQKDGKQGYDMVQSRLKVYQATPALAQQLNNAVTALSFDPFEIDLD